MKFKALSWGTAVRPRIAVRLVGPRRLRDIVLPLAQWETVVHALIIEDESMIAMAIEDILRDIGFTSCDIAPSPQTAIAAAAIRWPDLITSDVHLKPGCGIEAVLTICKNRVIPVIFITGNVPDVMCRLPNCCALSKPFSSQQLSEAVKVALH